SPETLAVASFPDATPGVLASWRFPRGAQYLTGFFQLFTPYIRSSSFLRKPPFASCCLSSQLRSLLGDGVPFSGTAWPALAGGDRVGEGRSCLIGGATVGASPPSVPMCSFSHLAGSTKKSHPWWAIDVTSELALSQRLEASLLTVSQIPMSAG